MGFPSVRTHWKKALRWTNSLSAKREFSAPSGYRQAMDGAIISKFM